MGYNMVKKKQNCKKSELINAILEEYKPEATADVQDALKDIFEPKIIPKRSKDLASIEDKVISMYAKGMSNEILQIQ